MPLEIRAFQTTDIAAVLALWSVTDGVEIAEGDSPEEIARFLQRNDGLSTVAADSGKIIAAVQCGHDGRRGFLYHLAVAAEHRGRGVGRQVVQRSIAGLKREGIVRALLFVAADNDDGHAFWLREGWEDMPSAKPMALDL